MAKINIIIDLFVINTQKLYYYLLNNNMLTCSLGTITVMSDERSNIMNYQCNSKYEYEHVFNVQEIYLILL